MKKIFIVYIIIGILISGAYIKNIKSNQSIYNHIAKVDNEKSFNSALIENIGDTLVEGQITAVNPIDDKYSYLLKVTQVYETHTKTTVDEDGNKHTTTSGDWETINREETWCNGWLIYGFQIPIIDTPPTKLIKTEQQPFSNVRYKYYASNKTFNCTIKTNIKNNFLNYNKIFYNKTIEQVIKNKTGYGPFIGFIIIYLMIGAIIYVVVKENFY